MNLSKWPKMKCDGKRGKKMREREREVVRVDMWNRKECLC